MQRTPFLARVDVRHRDVLAPLTAEVVREEDDDVGLQWHVRQSVIQEEYHAGNRGKVASHRLLRRVQEPSDPLADLLLKITQSHREGFHHVGPVADNSTCNQARA